MTAASLATWDDVRPRASTPPRALAPATAPGQPGEPAAPSRASSKSMTELWEVNGAALTRFALKLTLGNAHRADDIVQETLIRAWRNPHITDGHAETIRPWLFTVARHVATDLWRTQSRHDDALEYTPKDWPDPAQNIDQAITALDVRAAIAQLTPDHQEVITQIHYLGRTVAETATLLGIPEGTVKSRSYYALRHLKRILEQADQQAAA
jgi:RNA polymerase sigma-70 factor, ECF subfamily